jgi:hypothetical protein
VPARSGESTGAGAPSFHCWTRPLIASAPNVPCDIPEAIGEQAIQIGKVRVAVDEKLKRSEIGKRSRKELLEMGSVAPQRRVGKLQVFTRARSLVLGPAMISL